MRSTSVMACVLTLCVVPAQAPAQAPPPPPTDPPAEVAPEGAGGTVDMRGAMKRYDFDQGNQYLWGAIGGTVGSLALGAAAFGIGGALCEQGPRDCRVSQTLLGLMGWSTGLIGGSMLAVNLTGGERATGLTQLASFGGGFYGMPGQQQLNAGPGAMRGFQQGHHNGYAPY